MRPILVALLWCCLAFADAAAIPSFRLSWDDCSVLTTDKSWSGPGIYSLVVSGTGFNDHYHYAEVGFYFNPARVAPAWDFSVQDMWGGTPCHPAAQLTLAPGPSACPAYPSSSVQGYMIEGSITGPGRTWLDAWTFLDPSFTPDESQRYTLFRIGFDHSQSVEGAQLPPACGGAEEPMCIAISFRGLVGPNGQVVTADEVQYVTWQDPSNSSNCPAATPAKAKTWGAIKAQYR